MTRPTFSLAMNHLYQPISLYNLESTQAFAYKNVQIHMHNVNFVLFSYYVRNTTMKFLSMPLVFKLYNSNDSSVYVWHCFSCKETLQVKQVNS